MNRKNNSVKWPLLALLCLLPLTTALICFGAGQLQTVAPLGFLQHFLEGWFDPTWLLLGLSVLPLAGWLLLHLGRRPGKWIINAVLGLLLAADVIVLVLHFITALSMKSSGYLSDTFLLAIACPVVCIPALILTNKWYPKI